jgi:hypothetical protein
MGNDHDTIFVWFHTVFSTTWHKLLQIVLKTPMSRHELQKITRQHLLSGLITVFLWLWERSVLPTLPQKQFTLCGQQCGKVGKTLRSHKNQFGDWGPNDPGLGCVTSARLPNMRPVVGKSSVHCPCASRREHWQAGGSSSYPANGQDSNPRSELIFVRTQRFTNFATKAIYDLRTVTGSGPCPSSGVFTWKFW